MNDKTPYCRACFVRRHAENKLDFNGPWSEVLLSLNIARKLDHAPDCTYVPRHDESFVPPIVTEKR